MLSTLSSPSGFGLRLAPTISTGTLGFSRLARRSIFIVVCTLADSLHEPFASRASTGKSFYRIASTASGWNVSCRAGYLPPTGLRCPFHGAPELRPPMVCVKLPESVLGLFHLFNATKLPLFRIEGSGRLSTLSRVSSWRSLSGLRVDKAASYRRMSILTAHDAIYASVQEERARPTYQRVLHPRANTGVRRSKVEASS